MAQIVVRQGPEGAEDRARAFRLITAFFSDFNTVANEVEGILGAGTQSAYGALLSLGEVGAAMVMLLTDRGEDTLEVIDRIETAINRLNSG